MFLYSLVIFGILWYYGFHHTAQFVLNIGGMFWIGIIIYRTIWPVVYPVGLTAFWGVRIIIAFIQRVFPGIGKLMNGTAPMTGVNEFNQALDDTVVIDGVPLTLAYLDTLGLDAAGTEGSGLRIRQRVRDFLAKSTGFHVVCMQDPVDPSLDFVDAQGRKRAQVAIQTNGTYDVGLTLIHNGLALAAPDAPPDYVQAQQDAQAGTRGVWAKGGFRVVPDLAAMFHYTKPATGWVVPV